MFPDCQVPGPPFDKGLTLNLKRHQPGTEVPGWRYF
jgi:hypothetical protein